MARVADYNLVTRPMTWIISRPGGFVRTDSDGDVHLAEIKRLDTGLFLITSGFDTVRDALVELNLWDGSGSLGGPVVRTFDDAVDIARQASEFVLDMHWTKEEAERRVERRHQKKVKA